MAGAALLCRIGIYMWICMQCKGPPAHSFFIGPIVINIHRDPQAHQRNRAHLLCFRSSASFCLIFAFAYSRAFTGQLADVALWNKPLGLDDVRAQINNEQGRAITGDTLHRSPLAIANFFTLTIPCPPVSLIGSIFAIPNPHFPSFEKRATK